MTGDPRRDTEPTPHDFESLPVDEYAAAKAERYRKKRQDMDAAYETAKAERGTCGLRMDDYFNGVSTVCGRPAGHDGVCWPVALISDRREDGE